METSLTVLLGSQVGLRASEMARVTPGDKHRTDTGGWRLRIREAKDTTGEHGGGKIRDAYLPDDVERELLRYERDHDITDSDTYLGVTPGRIRQIVREAARSVDTGRSEDWQKLSSHDLRRYFAQTLLVRENVNVRVVMAIGGWSSVQALDPYISAPTPEVVDSELDAVEF